MAPAQVLTSGVIFQEIVVAGVVVRALVDSGASTSCCTRRWYKKYQNEVGPLQQDSTKIVGVGNIPINVDGRTSRLPLEWDDSKSFLTLLVIPTLEEPDMILGMDVLQRLGVRIDARTGTAKPTVLVSSIKPEESWRVPARTSVVFSIRNPYEGQKKKKILFEPSEKLPQVIRGTTSLGSGQRLYIRLENVGEEDQVLDPTWEIGTAEVVEEEPDFPTGREEEEGLPEIPEELSEVQRRSLQELLDEFKDVFVGRDFRLGSTGVVEHEIHTHGPPIRQPFRRQNPEVRRQEQEQLKEMLEQGIVRPSSSPWASPVVMVKKKRWNFALLY